MQGCVAKVHTIENFSDNLNISKETQVKLVVNKLKGKVFAWWEQLQYNPERQGNRTWPKMKWLLQRQFLPSNYEQFLYQQYQNCRQANLIVNECTEVFDQLHARVNLFATENQLIAHYILGLKLVIQDRLAFQGVWTMTDVVNLAMKVENQINRSMVCRITCGNQPKNLLLLQKDSTTLGINDDSNKDVTSTENSVQN